MHGNDFIYFFQDNQNRFWGLNPAGEVVLNANPYPLDFSPVGWDEAIIKNVVNRKYFAVDRTVSSSFKYVEDAAKILKHIFYKKGPEESVYLVICEQRLAYTPNVSYGFWYKQIFKSEIDLSSIDHDGPFISLPNIEEGLAKHLKANENSVYEFDLANAEKVKADGIILKESAKYTFIDGYELIKSSMTSVQFIVPMSFQNKDGQNSPVAFVDSPLVALGGATVEDIVATDDYFAAYPESGTAVLNLTIAGNLKFTVNQRDPSAGFHLRFLKTGQTTAQQTLYQVITDAPLVVGTTYDIPFSTTIPLNPGEKLYLVWFYTMFTPGANDIKIEFKQDNSVSVSYTYRFPATYVPFLRPQYLFAEFINRMTGGEYSAEDCPFFGLLQNFDKVFTSGDGARGLPGAKLKMSFTQFFSFFDTYDAVGIQEKAKKVLFDRKKVLFDAAVTVDIGELNNPTIKYDKTLPFNELAIGYPDVKNETGMLNGKNEVNTTFNFSLGTLKTPRKLEKISQVKTSAYDFENTRIEGYQKESTDNKTDNDVYALHITNTLIPADGAIPAHYELDRVYNSFVTGVEQVTTIFNLIFSSKNCFLRSGDYLRSLFYKCENKIFKFLTADRNDLMAYINGPVVIVEKADVQMTELSAPFFQPVLIEGEADTPDDLNDIQDNSPLIIFDFTIDGLPYKGLSIENSVNPKTLKRQKFTMWSLPENDLSKLIQYHG